jgi:hypothetical protein
MARPVNIDYGSAGAADIPAGYFKLPQKR